MKYIKLFEQFLNEGVNDPNILKAFFMAGGPGSGKSFVAGEVFGFDKSGMTSVSYATGLKVINSDAAFEMLLKEGGFDLGKLGEYLDDKNVVGDINKIRSEAKGLTKSRQALYMAGRLGLIIDGTGKDFGKIEQAKKNLESLGYDTHMVFVNTSKEVAIERNQKRARKLSDKMVIDMWNAVQENLGKFQNLFGKGSDIIIVDNTSYEDPKPLIDASKFINKMLKRPIQNRIGKQWIESQKKRNA